MDIDHLDISSDTVRVLNRGTLLKDGATVLESSSVSKPQEGFVDHAIILALTSRGQYVTWVYRVDNQSTGSGEYTESLPLALKKYQDRCNSYGFNPLLG